MQPGVQIHTAGNIHLLCFPTCLPCPNCEGLLLPDCSEWAGSVAGGYLSDLHAKVMVVTLAYVVLGGAFSEWCWTVQGRSQVHFACVKPQSLGSCLKG